jgi:hypothetical protein
MTDRLKYMRGVENTGGEVGSESGREWEGVGGVRRDEMRRDEKIVALLALTLTCCPIPP